MQFGHLPRPSARPCDWAFDLTPETDLERCPDRDKKTVLNPRDITNMDAILRILKQAWAGEPPELT